MNNAVTASHLQEDNVMARKFLTMDGNEAAAHAAYAKLLHTPRMRIQK